MNAIRRTVSSQTKGQYDFTLIPLQLPTALLSMLLEPIQCKPDGKGWTFCEHAELVEKGIEVEAPGDGLGWAVLHAGEHIKTGVQWLPGGAVTFYEAKIEIPFLRPLSSTSSFPPTTLKSHVLFSSALMTHSASLLSGIKSSQEKFNVVKRSKDPVGFERYEVVHWLVVERVQEKEGEGEFVGAWSEQAARGDVGGHWIAERSGNTSNQFHLTSVTAPRLTSYKVTLNLSRFFPSLPLPEIESILDRFPLPTGVGVEQRKRFVVNEEGWLVFFTESWDLNERFWLESVALDSI